MDELAARRAEREPGGIPESKIQAIKAEHPDADLHLISTKQGDFVVKSPSRGEFRRFRTDVTDARKKVTATEVFVSACVVYPPPAELQGIFDRYPAMVDPLGNKLLELAGMDFEISEKKL